MPPKEPSGEKLLNEEDTQRFQAITDGVMYLGLVVRYDISYSVNQLTRALPKSSKSHMAATKHLLRYLAGTTDFTVGYKQGDFNLTKFSDANWGNNSDNGNSRSPHLVFLASAPINFNVGLQELTELVATALIMKEAMFCSNMMKGLGFGTRFDSVPLHLDNTSTLHVAGNQTYSPRVKDVVLRYFFVQKLARWEGQISIHYVKTEYQLVDIEINT